MSTSTSEPNPPQPPPPPPSSTSTTSTTTKQSTLEAKCHCKSITLTIPHPTAPLNECLCSICRRYGARWAYYHPNQVTITITGDHTTTDTYCWGPRTVVFHRCKECGCATHWTQIEGREENGVVEMGVNCTLLEREVLEGLEVRQDDGPD